MIREPEALTSLLTPRQAQILICIGEGMTNREIGQRLGLAEKTIKNAVTIILAALGVTRRSQAAVYAVRARGEWLEQVRRPPQELAAAHDRSAVRTVR